MRAASLLQVAASAIAIVGCAQAQLVQRTATDLINFLSRPAGSVEAMGLEGGCPDVGDDRAAAINLSMQGESAIPEIERALKSLERGESVSSRSAWILYAYAKIRGMAAYPMIATMSRDKRFTLLEPSWDRLIALSLSLTSYVSESHAIPALRMADGRVFFCRPQEPRDALDQLISSWMSNDRKSMEATLGPNARTTMDFLLKRKTWSEWRSTLTISKPGATSSVGYSFGTSGRWAQPEEPLTNEKTNRKTALDSSEFDLETKFTDATGKECGQRQIRFVYSNVASNGSMAYRIDNVDIDRLVELIGTCAAKRKQD